MGNQLEIPEVADSQAKPVRCDLCGHAQLRRRGSPGVWWRVPCGECGQAMLRRLTAAEVFAYERGAEAGGAEAGLEAVKGVRLDP